MGTRLGGQVPGQAGGWVWHDSSMRTRTPSPAAGRAEELQKQKATNQSDPKQENKVSKKI